MEDEPLPRYLILNYVCDGRPLYVVLGASEQEIDLITVYRPDPLKWDETLRYRR